MRRSVAASLLFLIACATELRAERKVQGFIVTSDEAKVYKRSKGDEKHPDEVIYVLKKGDPAVGSENVPLGSLGFHAVGAWLADEADGRLHIEFLKPTDKGELSEEAGWVSKDDVVSFRYECGCGGHGNVHTSSDDACSPYNRTGQLSMRGIKSHVSWNECFMDGVEKKKDSLASKSATKPATETKESPEERLKKLNDLYEKKLITKEEYEAKRAQILKDM